MKIQFKELKLEHIEMHADHTPLAFGHGEGDEQLVESITALGVLIPLVVMQEASDCYRIVDGHRRYLAANQLGHESVLCSVVPKQSPGDYELLRFQLYATTKLWSKAERQQVRKRLASSTK